MGQEPQVGQFDIGGTVRPTPAQLEEMSQWPDLQELLPGLQAVLKPEELAIVTGASQPQPLGNPAQQSPVEGLQTVTENLQRGFSDAAGEIDLRELIPALGGMAGGMMAGPPGAVGGGMLGDLAKQGLQGDDFSMDEAMLEGTIQGLPLGLLRAAPKIAASTIRLSPKVQAQFPRMMPGKLSGETLAVPSEGPAVRRMIDSGIRPSDAGRQRAMDLSAAARQRIPTPEPPVRPRVELGPQGENGMPIFRVNPPQAPRTPAPPSSTRPPLRDPHTRQVLRTPEELETFAGMNDNLAEEMLRQSTGDVGGLSTRDQLRLLLQRITFPLASAAGKSEAAGGAPAANLLMGLEAATREQRRK